MSPKSNWSKTMMLHVEEARYLGAQSVWLRFNDGSCGNVDLADELDGPIFEPLKNVDYFRQFVVRYNTLSWQNGADFAPEFLRDLLAQQNIQAGPADACVEHGPIP